MHRPLFAALTLTVLVAASSAFAQEDAGVEELPQAPGDGGVRFPAVNLIEGQSLRAVVSNVRVPAVGASARECPVQVRFFGRDGTLAAPPQTVRVKAGASAEVPAAASASLLRTIVSVTADPSEPDKIADPGRICAVRATVETFDTATGRTLYLIPSDKCLGNAACTTTMHVAAFRRRVHRR